MPQSPTAPKPQSPKAPTGVVDCSESIQPANLQQLRCKTKYEDSFHRQSLIEVTTIAEQDPASSPILTEGHIESFQDEPEDMQHKASKENPASLPAAAAEPPRLLPVELDKNLQCLLPPQPNQWNKYLPGTWVEPEGFRSGKATAMDAFLWALWWLIRAKPKKFAACMLIISAQCVVAFFIPSTTQELIEHVCTEDEDCDSISRELFVNVVVLGLLFLCKTQLALQLGLQTPAGGAFIPATRTNLVAQLLGLSLRQAEDLDHARLFSTLQEDIDKMDECIASAILAISSSLQLAFIFAVLARFRSFQLLGMVFVAFPTLLIFLTHTSPVISTNSEIKLEQSRKFMAEAQEIIEKGPTIRVMHLHEMSNASLKDAGAQLQKTFGALKRSVLRSSMGVDTIRDLTVLAVLGGGVMLVNMGYIETMATVIAFYAVIQSLFQIVAHLVVKFRSFQIAAPSIQAVAKLLRLQRMGIFGDDKTLSVGGIALRDVHFGYAKPDADDNMTRHDILCGLDLFVPDGHKVALVGRSGAGKSTLLKTIARQYIPDSGHVLLGGEEVNGVDLRATVAMMEQSRTLYNETISDNINLSKTNTDAEIEAAATSAGVIGCKDTKWTLPGGLGTSCGYRGSNLNLGMQQRVVVARTLIRKTPIMLFDEPTSGLDVENVLKVTNAICSADSRGRDPSGKEVAFPTTVIAVLHTLEVLDRFDAVAFLEDGKIVEYGPCNELLAKKQYLYRFLNAEASISFDGDGNAHITGPGLRDSCPLFSYIKDDSNEKLAACFQTRTVAKGDTIYTHGESLQVYYIVAKGQVSETFYCGPSEYRTVTLGVAESLSLKPLYDLQSSREAKDGVPSAAVAVTDTTLLALRMDDLVALMLEEHMLKEGFTKLMQEMEACMKPEMVKASAWPLMSVPDADLQALMSLAQPEIAAKNDQLCSADSPLTRFYVVVSGRVMLQYANPVFLQ
ncbi:hypothetical protein CYMTET_48329, partial [Cymbomonas tetramitiformis]